MRQKLLQPLLFPTEHINSSQLKALAGKGHHKEMQCRVSSVFLNNKGKKKTNCFSNSKRLKIKLVMVFPRINKKQSKSTQNHSVYLGQKQKSSTLVVQQKVAAFYLLCPGVC